MGADIGGNVARIAAGSIAKRLARLGGNTCNRALPTGVHHGKSAGGHQHHGYAVGKAEQHGHVIRRTDDGIAALGNLLANSLKIVGAVRSHRNDMVTMYLIGHEQIMLALSGAHSFERSTTIFLNCKGVIAYMRAQVERGVRIFGNTTGALGKGKADIGCRALHQRNSILVDTRNVVRTCCHTKAS